MRRALYRLLCACGSVPGRVGNTFLFLAAGLRRSSELESEGVNEWNTSMVSDAEVDAGLEPDERRFFSRFLRPADRVLLVGWPASSTSSRGARVWGRSRRFASADYGSHKRCLVPGSRPERSRRSRAWNSLNRPRSIWRLNENGTTS